MEKIFEIKIKLFKKPNNSPLINLHWEGDDTKLRKQDMGMLIVELEKMKNTILSWIQPDAKSIIEDIDDEVED